MSSLAFQIDLWQEGQGSNAVIDLQNTPYAEYWQSLPSLQSSSNESSKEKHNNTTTMHLKIDGYSLNGRMAVYHFLMNEIDAEALWGETSLREYHWLWAYAAQLDWQHRSGRLQSFGDSVGDDTISPESWWGYMNFGFSVAILLGWKETQPNVTIELDTGWESFFRHGYREFVDNVDRTPNVLDARYTLQHHVWDTHTSVIAYCQNEGTMYSALLDILPPPERKFGEGWARMVHVLAAACFPTDLVTLKQDGGVSSHSGPLTRKHGSICPDRIFYDACRRRTVLATHDLVTMSPRQIGGMIGFWKRVAQTEHISRLLPRAILDLYHRGFLTKLWRLGWLLNCFFRPQEKIALAAAVAFPFLFKMLL